MRATGLRVLRDLKSTWGQSLGLTLLVAVVVLALAGAHRARRILRETRDGWTRDLALADLEVRLSPTRADVATPVRALPGVADAELRLVVNARLDVGRLVGHPASVRVLPADGTPRLDRLHLLEGRWPNPGEAAAVVDRSLFALHGVGPGQELTLRVGAHTAKVPVVGVALSPEHLLFPVHPEYSLPIRGGLAVVHVSQAAVAHVPDAVGLADSLLVSFVPGADPRAVGDAVVRAVPGSIDGVLPKAEQPSVRVAGMLIAIFDTYLPVVAAVLGIVSLVLLTLAVVRRVRRSTIELGMLLAVGHSVGRIMVSAAAGALAPAAAGVLLGGLLHRGFAGMLLKAYHEALGFAPYRDPGVGPELAAVGGGCLLAAASAGALAAWLVAKTPPARLLRAGSGPATGSGSGSRAIAAAGRFLPTSVTLGLAQPLRRPWATVFGVIGLGAMLGTTLAFLGVHLAYEQRTTAAAQRVGLDAVVRFTKPQAVPALEAMGKRVAGKAEPVWTGIAVLKGGTDEGFVQVVGVEPEGWGKELNVHEGRPLAPGATDEVVVDRWTQRRYGLVLGATVSLFPSLSVPEGLDAKVVGIVDSLSAGRAFVSLEAARGLYGAGATANGAQVSSPLAPDELEAALTSLPEVESAVPLGSAVKEILAMFSGGRDVIVIVFGLTVLLSVLFLGVTGAMDARDRMPDIAILHAIGWRDRSLRALMLTEVYARGALALLVAILGAPILERLLLGRLSLANDFAMDPVPAPWMPVILAALCALAFPLAAYPAWRSVRGLAPARALRLLARE